MMGLGDGSLAASASQSFEMLSSNDVLNSDIHSEGDSPRDER